MTDASAYLLGELDAERSAAFERALAADAALRDEVERLRPVVARLEALPPEAWEQHEPPPLRMPHDPAPERRRLVLRPLIAAACALALLAIGAGGALLADRVGDEDLAAGSQVALRPVEGTSGSGRVIVRPGSPRQVAVEVTGLRPTAAGGFYEVWLLGGDGRLVSLGSFPVAESGEASVQLPLPVDPSRFAFFDVSLEPGDGDPRHSGASVLRGEA